MTETSAELRKQAARHEQDAADSFERSDTDGFVSQWASGLNAQKARRQADIVEAGGIATFSRWELRTLDGEAVAARLINGRFGRCWAFVDEDDDFTGEFIGAFPARESTMARKGYVEAEVEFVAEAVADLHGSGKGLSGAASVQVITRPKDYKLKYDRVVGLGDWTEVE